jgi:prepilin-type N-terminal cleavage/methylation domain-containing protein
VNRKTQAERTSANPANPRAAFTLVEVMIAIALVTLMSAALYGTGLMLLRLTHFNRVSLEARALGIQLLEEISAESLPELAMMIPFPERTNRLQYGEQVVRSVTIIGHAADRQVITNVAASAYAEVHVHAAYRSPLSGRIVTNSFSTLVL